MRARLVGGRPTFRLELSEDETVDVVARPTLLLDLRRLRLLNGLERPPLLALREIELVSRGDLFHALLARISSAISDPSLEVANDGLGELRLRRHLEVLVAQRREEEALLGLAGDECRPRVAAVHPAFSAVEEQATLDSLRVRRVALVAVLDEDGADLPFEELNIGRIGMRISEPEEADRRYEWNHVVSPFEGAIVCQRAGEIHARVFGRAQHGRELFGGIVKGRKGCWGSLTVKPVIAIVNNSASEWASCQARRRSVIAGSCESVGDHHFVALPIEIRGQLGTLAPVFRARSELPLLGTAIGAKDIELHHRLPQSRFLREGHLVVESLGREDGGGEGLFDERVLFALERDRRRLVAGVEESSHEVEPVSVLSDERPVERTGTKNTAPSKTLTAGGGPMRKISLTALVSVLLVLATVGWSCTARNPVRGS